MSLFVIGLVGLALLLGGSWFLYRKAITVFTAESPADVRVVPPTPEEVAAASGKLDQLRAALSGNRAETFEFTAAELNALIARHPSFSDFRGKMRVALADSTMELEMSVPLTKVTLPGLSHRWFNGTAKFGLSYDEDSFNFALRSITANGRDLPLSVLHGFERTFSDSFNDGFRKSQRNSSGGDGLWRQVKTVGVVGDKLVITTKGGEVALAP